MKKSVLLAEQVQAPFYSLFRVTAAERAVNHKAFLVEESIFMCVVLNLPEALLGILGLSHSRNGVPPPLRFAFGLMSCENRRKTSSHSKPNPLLLETDWEGMRKGTDSTLSSCHLSTKGEKTPCATKIWKKWSSNLRLGIMNMDPTPKYAKSVCCFVSSDYVSYLAIL